MNEWTWQAAYMTLIDNDLTLLKVTCTRQTNRHAIKLQTSVCRWACNFEAFIHDVWESDGVKRWQSPLSCECVCPRWKTIDVDECWTDDACENVYRSSGGQTGTFSSPGYPQPYSTYVYCRYVFQGTPDERIRIWFEHFDLELGTGAGWVSSCHSQTIYEYYQYFAPSTEQHLYCHC